MAAAVGGGVGAALLIIAIVAVVLVIRKRRSPKNGMWSILYCSVLLRLHLNSLDDTSPMIVCA